MNYLLTTYSVRPGENNSRSVSNTDILSKFFNESDPSNRLGSIAAQVASQSTDSAVRRIAELLWLLIAGEFISEFGQKQNNLNFV
jgi:hypothetical protein